MLFWVHTAFATTWYVNSASGADTNNGTSDETAFATLQAAANSTAAGDVVYIDPGNGYGGGTGGVAPLVISTSGTGNGVAPGGACKSAITYETNPASTTRAVIRGTRAAGAVQGAYPLSCIVISNLELAGWNASLTWAGASANVGVSGTGWQTPAYTGSGIFLGGGTSGHTVHHFVLTNNYIHDFPGGGIAINYTDYVTVSGNVVSNSSNYSPFGGSGISLYELHNLDAGTGTKNLVTANVTYNNVNYVMNRASGQNTVTASGTSTGSSYVGYYAQSGAAANYGMTVIDPANGCIPPGTTINYILEGAFGMSQNTTCVIATDDTLCIGYVTDGEGIIVDNNTNTQSDNIAYIGRTLIENNINFANGSAAIECGPQSNYCDIGFNSDYLNQAGASYSGNSAAPGDINVNASASSNVFNNIMYVNSTTPIWDSNNGGSGTAWGYNLVYGGNNANSAPKGKIKTANPRFVNPTTDPGTANFQTDYGSPAWNNGNGSVLSRLTDILGNPGSNGGRYDMGAYEHLPHSLRQAAP